jgi:hypothetical protein
MSGWLCPCGDVLITHDELIAEDDEMATYLAGMVGPGAGFCASEDDVVPFAWAIRNTRLGRARYRLRKLRGRIAEAWWDLRHDEEELRF